MWFYGVLAKLYKFMAGWIMIMRNFLQLFYFEGIEWTFLESISCQKPQMLSALYNITEFD
jgi:hypothetical protein